MASISGNALIYMVPSLQWIMSIRHKLVCDCVGTKTVGTESPQNHPIWREFKWMAWMASIHTITGYNM
ncbi:hypothetical protein VN97_g7757 [Penicillium thymicola]|uniref:Uncharacterized protein n=1 Tax=Penicillium thymicola TaxID=293382 RepID=A0AAI9X685_PENTH|nr:hypothetical protein VN97_g7757 [Penicillium thymicola]